MKFIKTVFLLITFFLSFGQTNNQSQLINKKWKIDFYEQNKLIYSVKNKKVIENDYVIYFANHSIFGIYQGDTIFIRDTTKYRWDFDELSKTLKISYWENDRFLNDKFLDSTHTMLDKIISLNDTQMITETKFPDFTTITHWSLKK